VTRNSKMKILILGGNGMLGHELLNELSDFHEVRATIRGDIDIEEKLLNDCYIYSGINLSHIESLLPVISDFRPNVIVNAAGVVKQRKEGQNALPNLEINALLPHRLADICSAIGARLIHISTDCVFSGDRGNYSELDLPSPIDIYGHAKLLGETTGAGIITLRTSIVGLELSRKGGLVEWFLSQNNEIEGYRHAIFSGLTTLELSRIIRRLLEQFPDASGLYHLGGDAISKYEFLVMLRDAVRPDVKIIENKKFHCNRSLNSMRFYDKFDYYPPSWCNMIEELSQRIIKREKIL